MSRFKAAAREHRCSCTALRKAARRISQLYDSALAPSGLKITQRAVLAEIERSGPTTVGRLAEALVMDAGALAHTLKPLQRDGLVEVAVDPDDRRKRLIAITREGRTKLAETDERWAAVQDAFEAMLGRAKSDEFRSTMAFLASDELTAVIVKVVAAT